MSYAFPTNTDYVSSLWEGHRRRTPPSTEPGTDYASAYGAPLYAVGDGRVVDVKHTNSGAMGRYVTIDLDDGRRTRSLHVAEVWVTVGDRVSRGQQIGKTGASAWGSDWGVGAHVHQTLWPDQRYVFHKDATLDFARYVGDAPIVGTQRRAGGNGVWGRAEPSSQSARVGDILEPHAVGNFTGWVHGESVDGNRVWFQGTSGRWFWSGGFTDTGTHDLPDLNTPAGNRRTVGPNGVYGRQNPSTGGPATQMLEPGSTWDFNGWVEGQSVDGNSTWFRGANSGDWFWSGGFTDTGTHDLPKQEPVDPTPDPTPLDPLNPLNLRTYTPVYPRAIIGLEAPLGFLNCDVNGTRAARTSKGVNPVPTSGIIDRYIIHWAWPVGDDTTFFSQCNERGSCPTTYVDKDARAREFIRPGSKPAATGPEWNWRSWAVEVEPINNGDNPNVPPITDAQIDEVIEQIVFLREHDGKTLDGAPVEFKIDATHVIGHRDTAATSCPGDYLYGMIPAIIAEAQRRYEARHPAPGPDPEPEPEPTPGPLDPAKFPFLSALRDELNEAFGE